MATSSSRNCASFLIALLKCFPYQDHLTFIDWEKLDCCEFLTAKLLHHWECQNLVIDWTLKATPGYLAFHCPTNIIARRFALTCGKEGSSGTESKVFLMHAQIDHILVIFVLSSTPIAPVFNSFDIGFRGNYFFRIGLITKDFTGVDFQERYLYKDFAGINLALASRNIFVIQMTK